MAHELASKNGKASMAYVGEKPWHKLGQELQPGASIEVWQKAAGMDFTVEKAQMTYTDHLGNQREVPRKYVLNRSDNGNPVGQVAKCFKPVQPAEILEFYRDLTARNEMQLETAGVLKGGSVYWALAKTSDEFKVYGSKTDSVRGYVLLATSNDGSMATQAKHTSIRVVCNNTLTMATNRRDASDVRVRHASVFDASAVKSSLGLTPDEFKQFRDHVDALANVGVSRKESIELLADVFYPKRDPKDKEIADLLHVARVMEAVDDSPGSNLKSAKGTLWGLMNGVTYYIDHAKKSRDDDTRMRNAWFGEGETMKNNMFASLMQKAGIKIKQVA